MDQERQCIRIGVAVIACAVMLRLFSSVWEPVSAFFADPEVASFLIYLETGRVVKLAEAATEPEAMQATEPGSIPTSRPTELPEAQPVFFPEDSALIDVSNLCGYKPDLEAMLLSPLAWDLTQEDPAVLILHTHATESYTQTEAEPYTQSSLYRTLDGQRNMIRVGDQVVQVLAEHGIAAVHDRLLHDHPNYTGSYNNARKSIEEYLEQYPSIRVVLDIHRDALDLNAAQQLRTKATVEGQTAAQIMMVVGTDAGGLYHPDWQANMAFAVKLHAQLEKRWPGICRPISFRTERFNQDLSPGALIIEVGATGNTLEEALITARALAEGIAALATGTATADSTNS